jgi:DNA-binding response OmpR family regulator
LKLIYEKFAKHSGNVSVLRAKVFERTVFGNCNQLLNCEGLESMPKILVVEQDEYLSKVICDWLEKHSTVETAPSGAACQKLLAKHVFDVIVLDWQLAAPTGLEICKWYRARSGNTPILAMLKNSDDVEDVIAALGAGADDCLTKPFALRELTLRINALRRRNVISYSQLVQEGPLTIDSTRHTASICGRVLSLTATEFELLEYIARHPNNVLSATVLLNNVWKGSSATTSVDTVRAYVKRLRQKLEGVGYRDLIENVHGVGYRMNPAAASSAFVPAMTPQPVASFFSF